jgi:hypothetical protein
VFIAGEAKLRAKTAAKLLTATTELGQLGQLSAARAILSRKVLDYSLAPLTLASIF